jgi:Transcription factor WhiB
VSDWEQFDAYFYPPKPSGPYRAAERVCKACSLAGPCLEASLIEESATGTSFGFRGGLAPAERLELLHQVQREAS